MQTIKGHSTNAVPRPMLIACVALLVLRVAAAVHGSLETPPHLAWQDKPAEGKREDRPYMYLFVDSTNLATRLPTQIMESTAFTNREIISFVEKHYTPVRVDLKKKDGDKSFKSDSLAGQFGVVSAPTLVVALASGGLIDKSVGFKTDRSTLAFLKDAERNISFQRAVDCMKHEKWAEAAAYFTLALKNKDRTDEDRMYDLMYRYISQRRNNAPPAEAKQQIVDGLKDIKGQVWPRVCLEYFCDKATSDEVIAKAQKEKGKQTEGHYVIGSQLAWQGKESAAKDHFTWIRDSGVRSYIEYELAMRALSPSESKIEKEAGEEGED